MELTNDGKKGKINGTGLKWIAISTMLIDHTASVLAYQISITAYQVMRLVGRMAFPIFCFLLVQGYMHTKNVRNYALRLLVFAFISELAFDLAFYEGIAFDHQNVFFTLFIGLLTIHAMKIWEGNAGLQLAAVMAGCFLAFLLRSDYGYLGVLQIVLLFNYRYVRSWRIASVILVNALIYDVFSIPSLYGWVYACLEFVFASLSLVWIENYNGKRGKGLKYFFYAFYPGHLLILYLVWRILQ